MRTKLNIDMQTEVKVKTGFEFTSLKQAWMRFCAHFWLLYFFLSIAVIGMIFGYGLCAPLYILGRFYKPATHLGDHCLRRYIGLLMYVQPWLVATFDIKLPPRGPKKGLLIISNHRSTLEPFILLSRIAGIRIFTKTSLLNIPLLGMMIRLSGQIPAKKGKIDSFLQAMEVVRKRLRNGEIVHIFPELTRCPKGYVGVQHFSSFPFLVAIQEKVPIVPMVFHETDQVWPKRTFGINYGHPIKVKTLVPIDSQQFATADALKEEVKRLIEIDLHKEWQ